MRAALARNSSEFLSMLLAIATLSAPARDYTRPGTERPFKMEPGGKLPDIGTSAPSHALAFDRSCSAMRGITKRRMFNEEIAHGDCRSRRAAWRNQPGAQRGHGPGCG